MHIDNFDIQGLTKEQVTSARKQFGQNTLNYKKENTVLDALKKLAQEPMIILLLVASLIYFISGQPGDGIFLAAAIIIVSVISLYQDSRSRNALQKLKTLTQPNCKVIRDGTI
ncbi:MAG: Ca2+-transporting ATPase, partial [Marivirga sp.]